MGRRHAGLDVFADEYCFEERKLPCLSHVSRLGSDLGFSACYLSFDILLYLVEIIIMLLDLSYVEDMPFMLKRIWFRCGFMLEIILMHDYLVIIVDVTTISYLFIEIAWFIA